jgi:hypothetical protein
MSAISLVMAADGETVLIGLDRLREALAVSWPGTSFEPPETDLMALRFTIEIDGEDCEGSLSADLTAVTIRAPRTLVGFAEFAVWLRDLARAGVPLLCYEPGDHTALLDADMTAGDLVDALGGEGPDPWPPQLVVSIPPWLAPAGQSVFTGRGLASAVREKWPDAEVSYTGQVKFTIVIDGERCTGYLAGSDADISMEVSPRAFAQFAIWLRDWAGALYGLTVSDPVKGTQLILTASTTVQEIVQALGYDS